MQNDNKTIIELTLDMIIGIGIFLYFICTFILINFFHKQMTITDVASMINFYGFIIYMRLLRIQ